MARDEGDDDTNARIQLSVQRSMPNPSRPRLSPEMEERLAEIEVRSAACYASMEDLQFKLSRLVRDIEKGPPDEEGTTTGGRDEDGDE